MAPQIGKLKLGCVSVSPSTKLIQQGKTGWIIPTVIAGTIAFAFIFMIIVTRLIRSHFRTRTHQQRPKPLRKKTWRRSKKSRYEHLTGDELLRTVLIERSLASRQVHKPEQR
ncbi:hypothetical protein HZ326_26970 [Fusarium oxysporum f. sp. albedinis]|nr:hypothetical protein HZ326_26970 [Fusarium oxysporum f. sp. albedinis]